MPRRTKWDAGRFFNTLVYFEAIPFISWFKQFQGSTKTNTDWSNMGTILVAGATGGVGKRVVRRLVERNYKVRALVRDAKIGEMLGDKVELFEADITIPETLTPPMMEGVSAVICCTGTRVQPVEGDTPNREKYYQGIKFYLPEVVDTPEMVEYQGIKNLAQAVVKGLSSLGTLFDFTNPALDLKETWGAVDDVVMGGVSESSIRFIDEQAVFSGVVSIDNNGGFASVRTRNFEPPLNLSGYAGIELRYRGDGKRYKLIVRNDERWDGISYSYSFDTVADRWQTLQVPFTNLAPVFRAKTVEDAGEFDASQVYSMQLMLSKFEYDRELNPKFEPGAFRLEVESIRAYDGKSTPQFVMISSAGVTRPGRPGINLETEPPAVRMNEQLGGILTWKLRGEEALRESGLIYTIVRPCALTEEPADKALEFDQGDNIKGQVSREAIAQLCLQALQSPQASNKTFEVRENGKGETDWESLFAQLQSDR